MTFEDVFHYSYFYEYVSDYSQWTEELYMVCNINSIVVCFYFVFQFIYKSFGITFWPFSRISEFSSPIPHSPFYNYMDKPLE